jgi:hypothetical protein
MKSRFSSLFALATVSVGSVLVLHSSALALSANQINSVTRSLQAKGCGFSSEPATLVVSCPTDVVARAANAILQGSTLRLHYGSGKSYAQIRIGSSGATQKQYISNIYWPQGSPIIKMMPQNLASSSFSIVGVPRGFDLGISFESNGAEFLCELKTGAGYVDHLCPDVHWDNGRVNVALRLNRDFTIAGDTTAAIRGNWGLRAIGDYVIPDAYVNNIVSNSVNQVVQTQLPGINSMLKNALAGILFFRPGGTGAPIRCVASSFEGGSAVVRVALSDRVCAEALVRANS